MLARDILLNGGLLHEWVALRVDIMGLLDLASHLGEGKDS